MEHSTLHRVFDSIYNENGVKATAIAEQKVAQAPSALDAQEKKRVKNRGWPAKRTNWSVLYIVKPGERVFSPLGG